MPQATRIAAVRGQATWVSGYNVATGRESGGLNFGHELVEEVRDSLSIESRYWVLTTDLQ